MNSKPQQNIKTVKCPHCGHFALFAPGNPYRPFCSERCRLIDLGQWADETYRVSTTDSSSVTLNDADLEDDED